MGTGWGSRGGVSPALLDEALAGSSRRLRKITPRLAMQVALARAVEPGTAAATLRRLAQRHRETDPGYDLRRRRRCRTRTAFLQVRPFLRLLAGLCGQISAAPLPGRPGAVPSPAGDAPRGRARGPAAPGRAPGRPVAGGPLARLRVLAKDGTVRVVADPEGADRKGTGGQSRNAVHFGRPASTGADAAPQVRMVEVTDVWFRAGVAWAAGPSGIGETTLAGHLEPAYGPGDLDLADRGFPSREAAAAKITAGKHFAWRVSSAWNLRRSGRPLPDGTWKAKITWRGRPSRSASWMPPWTRSSISARPPPAHQPAARPVRPRPGRRARVRARRRAVPPPPGTVRVEVSETVTIITSLMDTGTYPARDIAELYGMRWASELVYLEEKRTLSGGQPVTAATPPGPTAWPQPPSPPTRRCGSPVPRSPPRSAPSPPGSAAPRCAR